MIENNSLVLDNSEENAHTARLSKLKAPTMALRGGHTKEVLSIAFNHDGTVIASSGADKHIRLILFSLFALSHLVLWNVYGDCENTLLIRGPSAAITEVRWNITQEFHFFLFLLRIYPLVGYSHLQPIIPSIFLMLKPEVGLLHFPDTKVSSIVFLQPSGIPRC